VPRDTRSGTIEEKLSFSVNVKVGAACIIANIGERTDPPRGDKLKHVPLGFKGERVKVNVTRIKCTLQFS